MTDAVLPIPATVLRQRGFNPFYLLVGPGVVFLILTLLLPLLAVVVFSFWRTESYELYRDWNLDNYRVVLTEPAYRTFLFRSFVGALITSIICLLFAWPVAYYIARHGGRYRLLLVLMLAAPFFTGVILRIAALQVILGPGGVINMGLGMMGLAPISALMYTPMSAVIGHVYLFMPFMVTAIYLSLVNFDFALLETAKVNGASPWRAFLEVTWPLNWVGTAIGTILVFIPCLASAVTPRFLGGPQSGSIGMSLGQQFGETGTWALGSAMSVILFVVSFLVTVGMGLTIRPKRSGLTRPRMG
jgi:ABC-type spermidine/putrescine transport system permease subunit I